MLWLNGVQSILHFFFTFGLILALVTVYLVSYVPPPWGGFFPPPGKLWTNTKLFLWPCIIIDIQCAIYPSGQNRQIEPRVCMWIHLGFVTALSRFLSVIRWSSGGWYIVVGLVWVPIGVINPRGL